MHWRTAKGPTGVSTVSLTPAKTCFASIIDTSEVGDIYCLVSMTPLMHDVTGVNDPGDMLRRCHLHRQIHASPVSLTPVNACFAGVNDTGEEFFAGVVDTGEAL